MTTQNLVSASIDPLDASDILQKLSDIRARLPFLITLDPEQVRGILKASNGFKPFVDKAHAVAVANPEILPKVFPYDEYVRDWELVQALTPIVLEAEKLASTLRDTLVAAHSDALVESMEVYSAVKHHKNRVPGLDVAHDELSTFFQKTRRKTDSVPTAAPAAPAHVPESALASVN